MRLKGPKRILKIRHSLVFLGSLCKSESEVFRSFRVMELAASELALADLKARVPIVTSTMVRTAARGQYVIAYLDCGCRPSEQRQVSKSKCPTLLECVPSLAELIQNKHAACIAERTAELEAATATAARKKSLGFLGTMMDEAVDRHATERRAAELLAARELVKSTKLAAAAAEHRANVARRTEQRSQTQL